MAKVTVSDHFATPVEKVFQVFTDIERASDHVSAIKKVDILTQGPFQLGTRWRETRDVMGTLDTAEMEVTSFERNRTYTITHHKLGARVDTEFWFEPAGAGTKVTIEFDFETPGLPPGMMAPMGWAIAGKVRDVLTHDLADLKQSMGG